MMMDGLLLVRGQIDLEHAEVVVLEQNLVVGGRSRRQRPTQGPMSRCPKSEDCSDMAVCPTLEVMTIPPC